MSEAQITDMRERLSRLETLVGDQADAGIRGDLRAIQATLSALQVRFALLWGIGLAAMWALNRLT